MSAEPELHWGRVTPVPDDASLEDLSAGERRRAGELRDAGARARFVAGSRLVRAAVGATLGVPATSLVVTRDCPDCDRQHGRPRVTTAGPQATGATDAALADVDVSISHTGDWVAVALCDGARVGVDIEDEHSGDGLVEAAALVLHAHERLPADAADAADTVDPLDPRALLRSWVRKEAVLKASGDGLRLPPSGIVLTEDPEPRVVAWDERPELVASLSLRDVDAPDGIVAAVAVMRSGGVRHRSSRS